MTLQNPADFETGLEDFDMTDAVIPRLSIAHKEAQFKDSLSGEQFDKISVIILGLVKQRVLWHQEVDDDDRPMCRSTDHNTGFPNMSDEQPKEKRFPWAKSGFNPKDYPPDAEGVIRLPCDSCKLKDWGSHPDGKRPYCSEQFTLPVLYDPSGDGSWVPAIITFQKTALKPLKAYLSSFARAKNAAFGAITEVSLDPRRRGQTDYAVPIFKKIGSTDQDDWREFAASYRTMREFLTAEPGSREEREDSTVTATQETPAEDPWTGKQVNQERKAESKKDEPKEDIVDADVVPESGDDDDELPF